MENCPNCGGYGYTPYMGDDYDYSEEEECEVCHGCGTIYIPEEDDY